MLDAKPVIIHVRYDNSLFDLLSRYGALFFSIPSCTYIELITVEGTIAHY